MTPFQVAPDFVTFVVTTFSVALPGTVTLLPEVEQVPLEPVLQDRVADVPPVNENVTVAPET